MSLINPTNQKWWVLAAMACSLSLIFLDQTGISVALPSIQRSLNSTSVALQWVVNAYLLAMAAVIILGGKLGDLFSHRRIYLIGVVIFIVTSLLCATARSANGLIAMRALQGVGAALMLPTCSAIMVNSFRDEERGRAMGLFVGIASVFLAIGPWLGGLLCQHLNWRWVFGINFPLALISIFLTLAAVPRNKLPPHALRNIDWLGFVLQAVFMCSLIIAMMEAANFGWTSPFILGLFALGFLSFGLFIFWEKRCPQALVRLEMFKNPVFTRAVFILMFVQVTFVTLMYWTIFLQDAVGAAPATSGLMLLPLPIMMSVVAPLGGYLRDRIGVRTPLLLGTSFSFIALIWVALFAFKHQYIWLCPAFFLFGCAGPLIISNCMTVAMTSAGPADRGVAGGLLTGIRQLGGAVGVAVYGSVIANLHQWRLTHFLENAGAPFNTLQEKQIDGLLAGAESAKQAISQLSAEAAQELHTQALHAFTLAFSTAMVFAALFALASFLLARRMPDNP